MPFELTRRNILIGLAGIVAAPTIVRASSIMPVRPLPAIFDAGAGPGHINFYAPRHIFVMFTGDDANDGSSWNKAKRTVAEAARVYKPGDKIYIGNPYPSKTIFVDPVIKFS